MTFEYDGLIVEKREIDLLKISTIDLNKNKAMQKKVAALFKNLQENGILQPVIVYKTPEGDYQAIKGWARVASYKELFVQTNEKQYLNITAYVVSLAE